MDIQPCFNYKEIVRRLLVLCLVGMRPVLVRRFFAAVPTADPLLFVAAVLLAVHALPELGAQDDASELGEPLRARARLFEAGGRKKMRPQ